MENETYVLKYDQIYMYYKNTFLLEYTSLVAQIVKNLPVMQEIWVWSLGWEGLLENGKATHSSILAWSIAWL